VGATNCAAYLNPEGRQQHRSHMIGPLPRHGKRRLQRRGRRYVSLIDAPQRGAPFASLTCSVGSAKLAPAARAYPVSGSPVSPAMRARLGRPGYGAV